MKKSRLVLIAVVLLTVCAFLPVLRNGFAWDDELNLLSNPYYRGLSWTHLRWMFTTAYLGPYQPLTWLSFGLDYTLWGLNPVGYHGVNLLLHALNAALVYALTARLLRAAVPVENGADETGLHLCAGAAALLFSVHPLRVEAVAWATERRTVLAGFFYLSAIWSYLRGQRAVSVAFFGLSLFSKGIGVALPVTLLALDVYPLRRLPLDARRWVEPGVRGVLVEKAPLFALAIVFGLVEVFAYSKHLPTGGDFSAILRVAKACVALVFYQVKTLLPVRLSPAYELDWPLWACVLLASGATWLLYRMRGRWPFGLPAWVHYVFTLAPVLGFYKFGEHLVADRYSYLACLPLPILLAGGLWSLGRNETPSGRTSFRLVLGAAAIAISVLGVLTWKQTAVWRDSITLWSHALTLERDSVVGRKQLGLAYYNLGNIFYHQGRPREAWPLYLESVSFYPGNAGAHNNLAAILLNLGKLDHAAAGFRRALELDPNYAYAYNGLGLALARKGELEAGAANFCRALSIDPALAGVAANLRAVLAKRPKLERSLEADCRRRLTTPE